MPTIPIEEDALSVIAKITRCEDVLTRACGLSIDAIQAQMSYDEYVGVATPAFDEYVTHEFQRRFHLIERLSFSECNHSRAAEYMLNVAKKYRERIKTESLAGRRNDDDTIKAKFIVLRLEQTAHRYLDHAPGPDQRAWMNAGRREFEAMLMDLEMRTRNQEGSV